MKSYFKLYYEEAENLYENSCFEEALSVFKKIDGYNENININNYIGCCYMNTNRFIEAEECFINLHKKVPEWETPVYNLGRLYLKLDDFEKAEHYIKMSLNINPNSPDANFYMGLYFEKSGQLEKAIEFYNISVEIEKSVEGYLNLSRCYKMKNDIDRALDIVKRAYAMDNLDSDVVYNLTYILIIKKCYDEVYNLLNDAYWINSIDVGILKNLLFSAIKVSDLTIARIVAERIIALDPKNSLANDFFSKSYGNV